MKIVKEVILRNIAGEDVLVPVGKTVDEFNGMFDLSPGAALIFREIEEGKDENAILAAILEEFEIDEQTAKTDMEAFLDKLRSFGIIE